MSLQSALSSKYDELHSTIPPESSTVLKQTTIEHKRTYDSSKAIQIGTKFPEFQLNDSRGEPVALQDLITQGPLLISFYRGQWCPYCNLELRALQKLMPEFKARGVTLVAITPELPDQTALTGKDNGVEFPVLSDVGNKLARQLGILFAQPKAMADELWFVDWEKSYGDRSFEIPVPAVFLVDKDGYVRNSFIEATWHERLEPSTALQWIDAL